MQDNGFKDNDALGKISAIVSATLAFASYGYGAYIARDVWFPPQEPVVQPKFEYQVPQPDSQGPDHFLLWMGGGLAVASLGTGRFATNLARRRSIASLNADNQIVAGDVINIVSDTIRATSSANRRRRSSTSNDSNPGELVKNLAPLSVILLKVFKITLLVGLAVGIGYVSYKAVKDNFGPAPE